MAIVNVLNQMTLISNHQYRYVSLVVLNSFGDSLGQPNLISTSFSSLQIINSHSNPHDYHLQMNIHCPPAPLFMIVIMNTSQWPYYTFKQKQVYNFDEYNTYMTITLKEISQFFLDLVNKAFIPVLQPTNPEHQRVFQVWRQASELLNEIEKISYWNLQILLRNINTSQAPLDNKQSKEYKKSESIRNNNIGYLAYDNLFDRKDHPYQSYNHEENHKNNILIKNLSKDSSESKNKSYKYETYEKTQYETKNVKDEIKDDNSEDYEKLIVSFRKLVNNFESNHRKLIREDQNFKENFKEGFTSTH